MAAYYDYSVPVSRLSAKQDLVSSDILLISEYNTESDSLYYTDCVTAGRYGELISAQFDIQGMKDETADVSSKITTVDADRLSVESDLDELNRAFLSNDGYTRRIPGLSAEKNLLSVQALSALRHERVVDLGVGDAGKFYLSAFSVNICRPRGVNLLRFVIPPEMPGLSRHFTVRISSDVDFIPVFYGDAVFFAERPFNSVQYPGEEIYYDFKEVRKNGFYVRFGVPAKTYDADPDEVTIIYHSGSYDDQPEPEPIEEITVTFDSNDQPEPTEEITVTFDSND